MDATNEKSENSVMHGGAADGLPNDGTGKLQFPQEYWQIANSPRRNKARPMARTVQRVPQVQICKGSEMDQNN